MAYFPFFVELSDKTGLIVGGGKTALGKAQKLAEYGPRLIVVAPEILPELESAPDIVILRRRFDRRDLDDGFAFVIAATDDAELNHEIADECRKRRIPVNVVDAPEDCSFLFPSLVRRGPLSVGISTGGASPSAAIHIKNEIKKALPDAIGEILAWLSQQRESVKDRIGSEQRRKAVFQRLFEQSASLGRPLTAEETESIIRSEEE